MRRSIFKSALFVTAAFFNSTAQAQAQDPASAAPQPERASEDTSSDVGDVILVTARRRSENQQDVPVSITAISGDSLTQTGVRDGTDLAKVVPSLSINQNSGRRDVIIFELRGISASDALLPQDPGVATYVNDFVHARPYGLQGALYDLESVQVLFGPQGTLFGRNSTAGAVLINTKKPELSRVTGDIRVALGDYNRREVTAAINLPLGDVAAFRFAGEIKKRDGFTRNLVDGRKLDNRDQQAFRFSSLVEDGGFTNVMVIDYYKSSDNGTGNKIVGFRNRGTFDPEILRLTGISNVTSLLTNVLGNAPVAAVLADAQAIGPRRTRSDIDTLSRQKVVSVVNTTSVELSDQITLKNIFGYIRYDVHTKNDLDGSALTGLGTNLFLDSDQWSDEFQVQGDFGNVNTIVGAYYFKEEGLDTAFTNAFSPTPVGLGMLFNAGTQVTEAAAENISKSVFAQATWKVTPELSLTAGGRYTWDTRRIDARGRVPASQTCLVFDRNNVRLPFTGCSRKEEEDFSDPSYTLSVDYKVAPDFLVYAAHRRGYRSGGFSPRGVNNATLQPFKPEKIKDYELGFKSEFQAGDVGFRLNAAAFYADYKNIQRSVATVINGVFATSVFNAAAANIKGGEATFTVTPFEGLTLAANASYVDFKVKRFDDVVINSLTTPATPVPVIVRDQTFPVSKWQYGINATYKRAVGDLGELALVFNYKWRGKSGSGLSFPFLDAEGVIPSYGLADASIRLSDIGGSGAFAGVFVENAFDKTALQGGLSIERTFGLTTANYTAPRMVGVEFGVKF
jgi:iron complex outermembrane receptor protein